MDVSEGRRGRARLFVVQEQHVPLTVAPWCLLSTGKWWLWNGSCCSWL